MYKILVIVLLSFIVLAIYNKSSNEESIAERETRITLLNHCNAKFQYRDEYYAMCPYDKILNLNYQEYVELDKPAKEVPDIFIKKELNGETASLIVMSIFIIIFAILLIYFRFFYGKY